MASSSSTLPRTSEREDEKLANKETLSLEEKIVFLKCCLQRDLVVADLEWSLFVAALSSYKRDTVLRPFPPMFVAQQSNIDTDSRDFKVLVS